MLIECLIRSWTFRMQCAVSGDELLLSKFTLSMPWSASWRWFDDSNDLTCLGLLDPSRYTVNCDGRPST